MATRLQIAELYVATFNRAADANGLAYWISDGTSSTTGLTSLEDLASAMLGSTEATAIYTGLDREATIIKMYNNILGRTVDATDDGVAYWSTGVGSTVPTNDLVVALINGAKADTGSATDKATIENKATVGLAYADAGLNDTTVAKTVMSGVTNDTATVTTAEATIAAAAGSEATGITGTVSILTSGMDTLTGTANDDKFYSVIDEKTTTNNTLSSFDTIDGANGYDTLNITLVDSAAAAGDANYTGDSTITNVEKLEVKTSSTNAAGNSVDVDGMDGLKELVDYRSSGKLVFNNIESTSTQISSYKDSSGKITTANFKGAAVNGTSDTVTLNVEGSSSGAAVGHSFKLTSTTANTGVENIVLNSKGTATNYVDTITSLDSGAVNMLETITVKGDAKLDITGISANIIFAVGKTAKFDASATTGGVEATFDSATADDIAITGGTGDDTFNMGTKLTDKDVIDGGDGTDTVSVNMDTFTAASQSITNVEVIKAEATAGNTLTLNTDGLTGLEKVILVENNTDNNDITTTDLAAGVAVELVSDVDGAQMGDVTLGLKDASGTTDNLSVTLKGTQSHLAADNTTDALIFTNIETLTLTSSHAGTTALDAADTNTITSLNSDTTLTKIVASGSDSLEFTLDGNATNLATIDASGMTDVISITASAGAAKLNITTGSEDDTITLGATLNNDDVIDGGSNSSDATNVDTLVATVTNLTATTGKLNVTNVEQLNLTNAGTATIDATGIVGATEIAFATTTKTTVTGLAAGTAIGVGIKGDTDDDGEYVVSLADETGTDDTVTFNLNDTDGTQTTTATLKTNATVENVAIVVNSTTDASMADSNLTVSALNAAKITVSGSKADTANTMTLNTLDTDTKTVDASGYYGILTASAATATATSFTAKSGAAHNFTGSSADDTFTITGGTANAAYTVNGNGGTDSLTIDVATGAFDTANISDVDTITLNIAGSATTTMATANDLDGLIAAKTVNITGGNAISSLSVGAFGTVAWTNGTTTKIDASTYSGKITDMVFTDDDLDSTMTVIGSAQADKVTAEYSTGQTIKSMTGIETLAIKAGGTFALDLKNVDDVTKVMLDDDGTARVVTLTDLDTGVDIEVEHGVNASGVVIDLIDSTSTTDVVNVEFKTTATNTHTYTIDSAASNDIETLNIKMTDSSYIDLTGFTMATADTYSTVNIEGAGTAVLTSIDTDIHTIDASAMTGAFTMNARTSTAANTITGGTGADTIIMMNAGDVLNATSGGTSVATADTLDINFTAVLGGLEVDLSKTGDQITTFNGSANSAIQSNFTSVDASGYTGSYGAQLTANKVGSAIVGTANDDVINLGAGTDTVTFAATAATNGADQINSFGTDALDFTAFATDNAPLANEIADTTTADADGAGGNTNISTNSIIKILDADGSIDTAAEVAALFDDAADAGQALSSLDANAQVVVLVRDSQTNGDTTIWYVAGDNNATNGVAASEVTLVGTLVDYNTVLADANIID